MITKPSRLGPSHDLVKASNFFALPEKPSDFFVLLIRVGLLVCFVASITLALHSAFFSKSSLRFALPDRLRTGGGGFSSPAEQNDDVWPTNISHVLFGIGASVNTWRNRSRYSQQWWDPGSTRGYAWLDGKPERNITVSLPYKVSADWTRFRFSSSQSAVRIARVVLESFRLGCPNVRWFVMGDDDTVFFVDNLVSVLARYDHNQMYYIGGNSESVEQDVMHTYDMAFGGGGFAISYPLTARLAKLLDGCLDRYYYFYGSDQRIWACVSEIGVPLTLHRGFHQLDIRGDPYGILAAHPLAPLVSLHHLDYLNPMFPEMTQIDSVKTLMKAYRVDPRRILQRCFCHDKRRKWSISIAWGYTLQIYPSMVAATDLQTPLQTFKTWRSSSEGPFTFNTRPVSHDPCQQPLVYFMDWVKEVGERGSLSGYGLFLTKEGNKCISEKYKSAMEVRRVVVSSMKMDDDFWKKAPVRQCCEIMDHGSENNSTMRIRIRKCRPSETVTG